jgi:hypothetical protein
MGLIGRLRVSFWITVTGIVVLYGFFATLATVSPSEVAAVTAVMVVLAMVITVRNLRVASELADHGGDPQLRRDRNRTRERRGF